MSGDRATSRCVSLRHASHLRQSTAAGLNCYGLLHGAARDVWRGMVWCGVESGMNEDAMEWTLEWKFQQFDDPTVWLPDVQRNSS